jgi:hypothetical protein
MAYEERRVVSTDPVEPTPSGGGSNATMMLTFLVGLVIILVVVLLILHGMLHLF